MLTRNVIKKERKKDADNLCNRKKFKVQPQGMDTIHGVDVRLQFLGFGESDPCSTWSADSRQTVMFGLRHGERPSLQTASIIHKHIHGWPIRHVHLYVCVHRHTHTNKTDQSGDT